MRGIPSAYLFFFFSVVVLVELVSYWGIRMLFPKSASKIKNIVSSIYFGISIVTTAFLFYSFSSPEIIRQTRDYHFFYIVVVVSILNLLPKTFFSLMTLLSFFVLFFGGKRQQDILLFGSFVLSVSIFCIILNGSCFNRHGVETREENLYFEDLPLQFDGFRIVQLSDIHLGTFNKDTYIIQKAVSITNSLKPDLLLFTGDIVNNFADEMAGYERYLTQFSAKQGKFAILGNHDYGDYYQWPDSLAKKTNRALIEDGMVKSGFQLLLNQSIKINEQDTSLVLIGVENWGHRPFPQYADLNKAMMNVPEKSFKILMSHDPAHWQSVVLPQTDIPLTLSGHTHGGQFGIKIAGIEFSPIYLIQRYWGGLYKVDNQYLYVNRGLGNIGFAGRVEMNPEVTLLILHRTKTH